ncbi:MAG: Cna B-type domain-containing protein, partial [Lachnospiraceae bacterium]|nr:Cna B-type domain-containing protein [Lachnospiraceae bacterium]
PVLFIVDMDENGEQTVKVKEDSGLSSSPSNNQLTVYDTPIEIKVIKTRKTSDDPIVYVGGAKFFVYEIVGESDKYLGEFTSSATGEIVLDQSVLGQNLLKKGGTYKLVEKDTPPGYLKGADLIFNIKDVDNSKATARNAQNQSRTINFRDDMIRIIVGKKGEGKAEWLPGAKLQLLDNSGTLVAEWVSEGRPAMITSFDLTEKEKTEFGRDYQLVTTLNGYMLTEGKYTAQEIEAPEGYSIAADVPFYVNDAVIKEPVIMTDKPLAIAFAKVDEYGKNLPGATMQILAEDGETVLAEWTSNEKAKIVTEGIGYDANRYEEFTEDELKTDDKTIKLSVGDIYYLHEVSAPEGYVRAVDDARIKIENNDTISKVVNEVKVVNPEEGYTVVPGTKIWIVPRDERNLVAEDYVYPDITVNLYRKESDQDWDDVIGKVDPINQMVVKSASPEVRFVFTKDKDGNRLPDTYDYKFTEVFPDKDSLNLSENDKKLLEYTPYEGIEGSGIIYNKIGGGTTSLKVKKKWNLYEGYSGKPDTVTVVLQRDGVDDKSKTLTFSYDEAVRGVVKEFEQLPKNDPETGKEYVYTVREEGEGKSFIADIRYTIDVDGKKLANIVNTPKIEPFKIAGRKLWEEPDGYDITKRPEIYILLVRDTDVYKITTPKADGTFEFDGLYEYDTGYGNDPADYNRNPDGHKFSYSIREINAYGYETTITYGADKLSNFSNAMIGTDRIVTVEIVNRLKNEKISIGGRKTWQDSGNYNNRPTVTIELWRDDGKGNANSNVKIDEATILKTDNRYRFKDLPKYYYEDGKTYTYVYSVREKALEGYVSTPAEHVISYRNNVTEYHDNNFINTPTRIKISKIDSLTKRELPGAILELRLGRALIERWVTTEEPHYIEGLVPGVEYTLSEVSAPAGYWLAEPQTITVTDEDYNAEVIRTADPMVDEPIVGEVRLEKRDADDRTLLSGAVFELRRLNGTIVNVIPVDAVNGVYTYTASVTTGSRTRLIAPSGGLTVTDLPYGTYYFTEVIAPRGYELGTRPEIFSISEATASRPDVAVTSRDYRYSSVTFLDRKTTGSVELYKASGDPANFEASLAGAVFGLYSATPRRTSAAIASSVYADAYYEYGTYVTDRYGRIRVDGLPWDRYYFIELEAPDGYVTNADIDGSPIVYTFEVNADTVDYAPVQVVNGGYRILDYREGITPPPLPPITRVPVVPPPTPIVLGERLTPTPVTRAATPVPTGTASPAAPAPAQAGVLGERRVKNESPIQGVLGVRSAPEQGVLGERVGPATGDAANIALWLIILAASVGAIVVILVQSSRRKKRK